MCPEFVPCACNVCMCCLCMLALDVECESCLCFNLPFPAHFPAHKKLTFFDLSKLFDIFKVSNPIDERLEEFSWVTYKKEMPVESPLPFLDE